MIALPVPLQYIAKKNQRAGWFRLPLSHGLAAAGWRLLLHIALLVIRAQLDQTLSCNTFSSSLCQLSFASQGCHPAPRNDGVPSLCKCPARVVLPFLTLLLVLQVTSTTVSLPTGPGSEEARARALQVAYLQHQQQHQAVLHRFTAGRTPCSTHTTLSGSPANPQAYPVAPTGSDSVSVDATEADTDMDMDMDMAAGQQLQSGSVGPIRSPQAETQFAAMHVHAHMYAVARAQQRFQELLQLR